MLSRTIARLDLTPFELSCSLGTRFIEFKGRLGTIYYIRILDKETNKVYYKLGYTSRTATKRAADLLHKNDLASRYVVTVVHEHKMASQELAYRYEQKMHKLLKLHWKSLPPRLYVDLRSGQSEVYTMDVLPILHKRLNPNLLLDTID